MSGNKKKKSHSRSDEGQKKIRQNRITTCTFYTVYSINSLYCIYCIRIIRQKRITTNTVIQYCTYFFYCTSCIESTLFTVKYSPSICFTNIQTTNNGATKKGKIIIE